MAESYVMVVTCTPLRRRRITLHFGSVLLENPRSVTVFVRTDINYINNILSSGPHNHPSSDIDVSVTTKKMKIKTDLIQTAGAGGNTHQTLLTHLGTLTPIERANFGSSTYAKRSFNRHVASGRPDEPDSLANLIIQGIWAEDQDGNPFLLHDNHNNANRIIVFASERCLSGK